MAFALSNAPRGEHRMYPDRQWFDHIPGYPGFRDAHGRPDGRRDGLDGVVRHRPGAGDGASPARDRLGLHLDLPRLRPGPGSTRRRTYRLRLPAPVPAKDFWSVVVYDLWTRSMLANGQPYPSVNSYAPGLRANADGAIDLYLGPEPPAGFEATGSHPARHRLVPHPAPLRPDRALVRRTWKPGDLEPMD